MDIVLSIVMLAGIALLVGAFLLWRRGGPRRQVAMMAILALVAFVNVAIWVVPDAAGDRPVDRIADPAPAP